MDFISILFLYSFQSYNIFFYLIVQSLLQHLYYLSPSLMNFLILDANSLHSNIYCPIFTDKIIFSIITVFGEFYLYSIWLRLKHIKNNEKMNKKKGRFEIKKFRMIFFSLVIFSKDA